MSTYNDDMILRQELTEHRGDADFDWAELERKLGELTEAERGFSEEELRRLGWALHVLFDWVLAVNLSKKHALKSVGMRTVAAAWVLNPARFGDNASLRSLSRVLGFNAANISPLTAEFSRIFYVFNKFQNHDWRKEQSYGNHKNQNQNGNKKEERRASDARTIERTEGPEEGDRLDLRGHRYARQIVQGQGTGGVG